MFDTRSFFAKLKSRKLLVHFLNPIIGALGVTYANDHPKVATVVIAALASFGLSTYGYHGAVAAEDSAHAVATPPNSN